MPQVVMVTGLAIGEETKGATVEWLARLLEAHTVVRSAGSQSGHHIVLADGREQMYSHFGAATLAGVRTLLLHMVVNPVNLFTEALEIQEHGVENPISMIALHHRCLIVTPFHGAMSRLREVMRGPNRKGTVGMGVGEAITDSARHPETAIRAGDLHDAERIRLKLETIRQIKLDEAMALITQAGVQLPMRVFEELELLQDESLVELTVQACTYLADLVKVIDDDTLDRLLSQPGTIVCEASHGALLHPRYGFVPHVTQVDPTGADVLQTLNERRYAGRVIRLGVSRCYATRHGAGPLPSFSRILTDTIHETHNSAGSDWLGEFRNGFYDVPAIKYAIKICGGRGAFDGLIISYLDVLGTHDEWSVCVAYEYQGAADNLDHYFELDDQGLIVGYKVHPDTHDQVHLDHQRRLAALLTECQPVTTILRPIDGRTLEQVFLDFVEEHVQVPVVAVARGPRAEDREVRSGWEHLLAPVND